ncbi:MAG: hypothetical protein KKG75_01940 [Nanoarchaeota archaeon]|nr:hypothetical protein [Nanoarchaeota archaeon]
MVALYGVVHGIEWNPLIEYPPSICPSLSLRGSLANFPKGTRIGLEGFCPEDLRKLDRYMGDVGNKHGLRFMGYDPRSGEDYWGALEEFCREKGFDIVYLGDRQREVDYIRAAVLYEKTRDSELVQEKGESDEKYNRKRIERNERIYRAKVLMKKTHELGRDQGMLDNLRKSRVKVAVVGLSHGDLWSARREELCLDIDSYSRQTLIGGYGATEFEEDAKPDPNLVYERESLLREIRFLRTGRIVNERTPDFVGTWDRHTPSEGYFEMFISELDGKTLSGIIEDYNGKAFFSGEFREGILRFTKYYDPIESGPNANTNFLEYGVRRFDDGWCGYFVARRSWSNDCVFMTRDVSMQPLNMALAFDKIVGGLVYPKGKYHTNYLWREMEPLLCEGTELS